MTKKEAIISYITEMNAGVLLSILDNDKLSMNVAKETSINKLYVYNEYNSLGSIRTYSTI